MCDEVLNIRQNNCFAVATEKTKESLKGFFFLQNKIKFQLLFAQIVLLMNASKYITKTKHISKQKGEDSGRAERDD